VDAFTFTTSSFAGPRQRQYQECLSLDYIFSRATVSYLDRTDLAHVKPDW
jgi:hypothetical protein